MNVYVANPIGTQRAIKGSRIHNVVWAFISNILPCTILFTFHNRDHFKKLLRFRLDTPRFND